MSAMTREEEIPTGHGDTATIEVVDCCSCEQTISHESAALVVVMDENENDDDYSSFSTYKTSRGKHEEGWLCEHCRDDPIQWPQRSVTSVEFRSLLFFILGLFLGGSFIYTVIV